MSLHFYAAILQEIIVITRIIKITILLSFFWKKLFGFLSTIEKLITEDTNIANMIFIYNCFSIGTIIINLFGKILPIIIANKDIIPIVNVIRMIRMIHAFFPVILDSSFIFYSFCSTYCFVSKRFTIYIMLNQNQYLY